MANKNETAKKVVGGVALGLVLVLAGGVCGGLLQRHFNWGEDPAVETPAGETANGGAIIGESHGSGVKLMSTKIAAADYEEYGVSPMAETAYQLTATITPSNATNKAVDWSVAFVNASSSWASGKTVTDYVTVTPTSDGALTATVECLQDFGEQIKVTAASRAYPDKKAECTVDYAKRIDSVSFLMQPSSGGSAVTVTSAEESVTLPTMDCSLTLTPSFTYSDYTVEDTFAGEYKIVTTANVDTMYNALDDVDATAGSITLYEDDIMFSGSGSTYSMEFGFLDNATAGVGDTYYYYEDPSLFNGMFEWLRSNSTTPLFAFEYELTGTHSSVSGSIDVLFDVGSYTIAVSGVGLDESNLIF